MNPLVDTRIRLRELQFKIPGSGQFKAARLPFGIGIDTNRFRFEHHSVEKDFEIRAVYHGDRKSGRYTIVFPGYKATDQIVHPLTGKQIELNLWTVYTDRDHMAARQVIQRVHYLADNGRGMFLACAFADRGQQSEMRARAKKKNTYHDDIPWLLPFGGIIGCGVVDTLWHGNPIAGRSLIASELNLKGGKWKQWSRDEVVSNMRVAWASRFAVDLPYQGLGIGAILARHLKRVARWYHSPAADFLEVITTTARSEKTDMLGSDFLKRAGYTRLDASMKSGSLKIMDRDSGYRVSIPALKHYYFADLRNE